MEVEQRILGENDVSEAQLCQGGHKQPELWHHCLCME